MASTQVTIRDIAVAAGVSTGTVSRALKSQQGMSEETRQRVFEVANSLGYDHENLRGPKLRRVLFLLHRQHQNARSNMFYSPVLHGVEDACNEAGIALSLASVGAEQNVTELVRIHDPGAVICAGYFEADLLKSVLGCGLPVVVVDHFTPEAHCINDDNFAGAYAAVSHLLQQGYRRIAFIAGPANHHSMRLRERGYRKALFDAQVLADPDYVVSYPDGADHADASAACMDQLLSMANPPDAVFACNDLTALVAMGRCQRRGLAVPQDIGICGYDDIDGASTAHPALTTVSVDKEHLGREAVACLVDGITDAGESVHPVRLIVRESSSGKNKR